MTQPADQPFLYHRADFLARCAQARRSIGVWSLLVVGIVLPVWWAVAAYFPGIGRQAMVTAMEVFLGTAIALMFWSAARYDRAVKRLGLRCPTCGAELIGGARGERSAEDYILETGHCKGCRRQILDPAEVGPTEPAPRGSALRGGAVIVVLVMGLAGSVYFSRRALDRRTADVCRGRYAAARTAADTARVDTSTVGRKHPRPCGPFRAKGAP